MLAAALAMRLAADGAPTVLVDLDPCGVHAELAGVAPGEGASAWAEDPGTLDAARLRAASIPHQALGALVSGPRGEVPDGPAVCRALASAADTPHMVIDCGSGVTAARRVDHATPVVLVVTRDAPGLRAARVTASALPGAPALVVVNEAGRRGDVGARAAARAVGAGDWVELSRHTRDAQRIAVGVAPGGRSGLARVAARALDACPAAAEPGEARV